MLSTPASSLAIINILSAYRQSIVMEIYIYFFSIVTDQFLMVRVFQYILFFICMLQVYCIKSSLTKSVVAWAISKANITSKRRRNLRQKLVQFHQHLNENIFLKCIHCQDHFFFVLLCILVISV